jgi:hypothetical protein
MGSTDRARVAVVGLLTLAVVLGGNVPASAIDHKNLDEGRPLRLEDAYPIAVGEVALEAGAGFTLQRKEPNRGEFPLQLLWGALSNLQLEIGSALLTDPHAVEEQTKSGDLQLDALYNFNQETLWVPAFAAKLQVNLPTGVDSSGVDVELKGIVTKSFDRLSLHFNAGYEFLNGTSGGEREGRYELVLGASLPIGAPRYTRTTLVADLFTEQSVRRGEDNVVGVELGFRHQLTPRLVIDAGLGTEFAGPADRAPLFGRIGASFAF